MVDWHAHPDLLISLSRLTLDLAYEGIDKGSVQAKNMALAFGIGINLLSPRVIALSLW